MPTTTLLPVQQAIYAALEADAPLLAKVTGIFDQVPDGANFPYVTVGEGTEILWDTQDHDGRELTVTLDVWSQAKGFTEALGITDDLNRLLNHKQLALSGATMVQLWSEMVEPIRDPDGFTRHVVVRYRALVQIP